jgi:homogentisate 1,2-dioxygenase
MSTLNYLSGFGNHFSSEAIPGSLPEGQNNPQKCPKDLYAEQLTGTAFTAPRHLNQKSWLYKLRPTVAGQTIYNERKSASFTNDFERFILNPSQMRWKEFPLVQETERVDFIEGIMTMAGAGDPAFKSGLAIYMYSCNKSMQNKAFYSSDGDFLIVPQMGILHIKTEMGLLDVEPQEIVVIPRGIKFAVAVDGVSRGYICEIFSGHLKIPDLGPIGANGLANPRDFLCPTASYEDIEVPFKVDTKFGGKLFRYKLPHSIFDVVAWSGNYYPYKYDLRKFNTMGTVSFDHPDPCIFTVLTCQTLEPGVAVLDFVIFPPRWMVAEHTFRPPYYHRNTMTEFMGNIVGTYDAKTVGFLPGTASLHSCMAGHGPEAGVFEKASNAELVPVKYPDNHMQFMFETSYMLRLNKECLRFIDEDYVLCWQGLKKMHLGS